MSKIVKSGTAQQPVYTESETTLMDSVLSCLMAPFKALSGADKEFISVGDVAVGAAALAAGSIFIGDRFGAKIPVLGGGRN